MKDLATSIGCAACQGCAQAARRQQAAATGASDLTPWLLNALPPCEQARLRGGTRPASPPVENGPRPPISALAELTGGLPTQE